MVELLVNLYKRLFLLGIIAPAALLLAVAQTIEEVIQLKKSAP